LEPVGWIVVEEVVSLLHLSPPGGAGKGIGRRIGVARAAEPVDLRGRRFLGRGVRSACWRRRGPGQQRRAGQRHDGREAAKSSPQSWGEGKLALTHIAT